ncbi:hypothetical protein [Lentzea flava]|uniref:Uncharacterized protein n=1 Tax=Lentzea flava TaxID=103732 RepID=A0ABQ2UL68_9PSEU|nr:hypothetical protein [Lentzea flava]MCP2200530.1 hypothetical protein [Lentzea flava]GGU43272.1 hypothetical protein GCM10010178_39710 [Lentzea flava]
MGTTNGAGPTALGAWNIAVTADVNGKVRMGFVRGAANQPQVNVVVLVPIA